MKLEDIKNIGILGAGVMGGGIAQSAIIAGYNVVCRDLNDEILARAKNTIINGRFGLKGGVERGKQTQEQMDASLARLTMTTDVQKLDDSDVLIEAIGGVGDGRIEDKPLKLKVFAEMEEIVKKDAIFATNTSDLTVNDIAQAVAPERRERFLGTHFFSPANIMKLVEVIFTPETSEETMVTIEGLMKNLGKTTIRVKDIPGDTAFVANRIFYAARAEAEKIVEEGVASRDDINTAMMLGYNWPTGPLRGSRGVRTGWEEQ